MIRRIPQTRRWTGPYLGDYDGDIWKTYNIDLHRRLGYATLSRGTKQVLDCADSITGSVAPYIAFLRTDADCIDRLWGLSNFRMVVREDSNNPTQPDGGWDTITDTDAPIASGYRDFTVHGNDSRNDSGRNKLFVTTDSGDIAALNDTGNSDWIRSWWVTKQAQPALRTTTVKTPIQYFPFRKITIIGDGNLIHTISRPSDTQNDTVSYGRLILPNEMHAWHIFTTATRAWINCLNRFGGPGAVIEWDGYSQTYNALHPIPGPVPLSGVDNNGSPLVLTTKGAFYEYSGNGFIPMYRAGRQVAFPVFEEPSNVLMASSDSDMTDVLPRGMAIGEDGLIYINARQPINPSYRQTAGVWCLDQISGALYNRYSLGVTSTGDTRDDTGSYGHQHLYRPGGIAFIPTRVNTSKTIILGGTQYENDGTITNTRVWSFQDENTGRYFNRGYFITQFIPADRIKEFWDSLWLTFNNSASSNARIVVKARGVRSLIDFANQPVEPAIGITWTSINTFTVTLAGTSSGNPDALQVGDEVEILYGANSGRTSHISSISGAHGALQTITVDEDQDQSSGSSRARFDRWKKVKTITANTKYEEKANLGIDSSFIQFKIEFRGPAKDMEIPELIVQSHNSLKLEN